MIDRVGQSIVAIRIGIAPGETHSAGRLARLVAIISRGAVGLLKTTLGNPGEDATPGVPISLTDRLITRRNIGLRTRIHGVAAVWIGHVQAVVSSVANHVCTTVVVRVLSAIVWGIAAPRKESVGTSVTGRTSSTRVRSALRALRCRVACPRQISVHASVSRDLAAVVRVCLAIVTLEIVVAPLWHIDVDARVTVQMAYVVGVIQSIITSHITVAAIHAGPVYAVSSERTVQ